MKKEHENKILELIDKEITRLERESRDLQILADELTE